jgi:hypothetical protein
LESPFIRGKLCSAKVHWTLQNKLTRIPAPTAKVQIDAATTAATVQFSVRVTKPASEAPTAGMTLPRGVNTPVSATFPNHGQPR